MIRAALCSLLVLLPASGCLPPPHPQAFDYESTDVDGVPTLTWSGDDMNRIEVRIDVGDVEGDGELVWAIRCADFSTLCIRSPVQMGFAPDDVSVEGTLDDVIQPGAYVWRLLGTNEGGTWMSGPVRFEVEEEVAVPDEPLSSGVLLVDLLRQLGLL